VTQTDVVRPFLGNAPIKELLPSELGLATIDWVKVLGVQVDGMVGGIFQGGHSQPPHLEQMGIKSVSDVER